MIKILHMETKTCTCKHCGSTATLVREQRFVPSFDDEGRWDGEDELTYETVICSNPNCTDAIKQNTDDLPF